MSKEFQDRRQEAMKWWNNLSHVEKSLLAFRHYEDRPHERLTGREIQIIYQTETQI